MDVLDRWGVVVEKWNIRVILEGVFGVISRGLDTKIENFILVMVSFFEELFYGVKRVPVVSF